MEVHTPESAPHGWRAFLREYVIVVIGVLTALAAEQSVQWLHRYTNRRQLEADLREEARMSDGYLRHDIKVTNGSS
jgi:type II secretory pathway pseudopilin PulG